MSEVSPMSGSERRQFWIKQISSGVLPQNRSYLCLDKDGMNYVYAQGEERYPICVTELKPDERVISREELRAILEPQCGDFLDADAVIAALFGTDTREST